MNDFRALWSLDPAVTYLNHGSFGACPRAVQQAQQALREEMERQPMDFLDGSLRPRLAAARGALAEFLGAKAEHLAFVPNATTGVNAVLRSLPLGAGDEILVTTHTYSACRKTVDFVAMRTGARVVEVTLPFPVQDEEALVAAVLGGVTGRTRLALLDHVTSPTALVLPVGRMVKALADRSVDTLVDGAHAPGMVPLALDALGAAYYTGNAHKWLCAPKGAAFLYVRPDRQAGMHPTTISHGYPEGFQAEFDWVGTTDPTAWLCVPEALRVMGGLLPGGWEALRARNHALAVQARALVLETFGLDVPCPETLLGSMAAVPLPVAASGSPAAGLNCKGLHDWFRARGVETWLSPQPVPLLRLSAQLYNDLEQFQTLVALMKECFGVR